MKNRLLMMGVFALAGIVCATGAETRVPEGYQELAYVESTGRQWVDTGIVTTDRTAIELDFTVTGDNGNHAYFCGDWANGGHLLVINGQNVNFFDKGVRLSPYSPYARYRFTTVPGGAETVCLYDVDSGDKVFGGSLSLERTSGSGTMTLFASSAKGDHSASYRLHRFRLTDTAAKKALCDYVPARRLADGAVGLYDGVTGTFRRSEGPAEFVAGLETEALGVCPMLSRFNPSWSSVKPGLSYARNLPTAALLGNGSLGAVNGGDANRKLFVLTRGDLWSCGDFSAHGPNGVMPISFCDFEILPGAGSVDSTDTLDIVSATLRTEGRFGKGMVKFDSFIAAEEDLFVVTGVTSADDEWTLRLAVHNQKSQYPTEAHAASDGFWVRRSTLNLVPDDPRGWTTNATAAVSACGATLANIVVPDRLRAEARLRLKANTPFAIVIANDPARRFGRTALARTRARHADWWRAWWGRNRITLGDAELERFYYGSLYLLGAGVRQGKFPPGLYGIWPTTDEPSWKNDFHLNYNYVATYYGCFAANRCEVAEAMPDPLVDYLPRALANAKKNLRMLEINYDGKRMPNTKAYLDRRTDLADGIDDAALYPVSLGPWGVGAKGDCQFNGQISDGAFQCAVMCTHWEYTLDRAYLKKVWPVLDKTANFLLKWREKESLPNGGYRYVICDSHWEGSGLVPNSAPALGAARHLFATLVAVTPVLREIGIDVPEAKAAAWRDMSEHLSELPTGTAKVGGREVRTLSGVEMADGKSYLATGPNAVTLESVIPGEAFAFDVTDDFRALATNTVNAMLAAGGDRIWRAGMNQTPKLYAMAIRMGYPCRPIIEAFRKFEIRGHGQPNFHLRDNVHGVEKVGAIEFVNSMLIQSDHGYVKVFPNWTGADAKFENLRAKGAFVVSAEMKGGAVTQVEVTSEKGGTFRLVDPFGGRVTPRGAVRGKTRRSGESTLELAMKPGERIVLR